MKDSLDTIACYSGQQEYLDIIVPISIFVFVCIVLVMILLFRKKINASSEINFTNKQFNKSERQKNSDKLLTIEQSKASSIQPVSSSLNGDENKMVVPLNPQVTFVGAQPEEQKKIKFIGYTPALEFEQNEPCSYPVVIMPNKGSVIKFPRKGRQGTKGSSEDFFKKYLLKYFKDNFQIFDDRFVLYKSNQNPYEPDFTLIDEKNDLNLFIDIEIDEPYDLHTKQPRHCIGFDLQRNTFFKKRGWIVIRFAELQILKQPLPCCKFISEVIKSINPNFESPLDLVRIDSVSKINQWTKELASKWIAEGYREKYLGTIELKAFKQKIILNNLNETLLGSEVEILVSGHKEKQEDNKVELLQMAINLSKYISCKITKENIYTIIKPISFTPPNIFCYCYLVNKIMYYPINDINDFILREHPFVLRMNGEKGVEEISSFIRKYIKSPNPIRIRYTKSSWKEQKVDRATGELILTEKESQESLRTITGFDIVSKVHSVEQIKDYRLNDVDYIAGVCHLRNKELRTFRYDRINELEVLNI